MPMVQILFKSFRSNKAVVEKDLFFHRYLSSLEIEFASQSQQMVGHLPD
jgi:hypothetical protein